jgi:NADPH:quinone reductase-like Zn-dependent oxidoreductase
MSSTFNKESDMKAIIYTQFGSPDVLQFTEVEKPAPKDNQVLVKVQAASVNALDRHSLRLPFPLRLIAGDGLRKPKDPRLGADIAGRIEAVGAAVKQFQPGDEVFGVSSGSKGGFAEYTCAREDVVAPKPANLSFEAAAAVPIAALTALQGLRDRGQIQPGQKVLINGAAGGVGTFAVQLAKAFGAEVTAVCNGRNVEMVRSIGADHIIDYTQTDFTKNGQRYDLILAVNGYHSIFAYRRALAPRGRYVFVGAAKARLLRAVFQAIVLGPVLSRMGSQHMGSMWIAKINQKDLVFVKELLEAGKVVPVIERSYPLPETAEAIRYLEGEHAKGKVVIAMDWPDKARPQPL